MGDSAQRRKREEIIASLRALTSSHSLPIDRQDVCVRCGAAMQYVDATFWLDESDSSWSVRLPYCTCEDHSTSAVPPSERNAV